MIGRISKKHLAAAVTSLIVGILVTAMLVSYLRKPLDDGIPAPLRIVQVGSLESLRNAINEAMPGDQITMLDGVYTTTGSIRAPVQGTAENPIVIRAQTDGGVEIGGSHGFYVAGAEHVIIRGFKLTHSQDNSDQANRCDDCIKVRFTSNTFVLKTTNNKGSDWLAITGASTDVRVDHNTFQNKSTLGEFLSLVGEGHKMVQNTIVDHNLFSGHSYGGDNGGGCLGVGLSALGPAPAYTIVEHNIFELCNGDPEAISVKSSNNVFRYNTFRSNDGSLVFRHGSNNIVDGNVFIDGRNGIRTYGANHKIINNYFANTTHYPIVIGKASILDDLPTQNGEYSQARNILIAHNTFVDNRINVVIGAFTGSYFPENVTVANNVITGSSGKLVEVLGGEVTFSNNILHPTGPATVGDIPVSGYTRVNPQLTNVNGIYRPSATSPIIDFISAVDAFGVSTDIDGQTRSGRFEAGADELG